MIQIQDEDEDEEVQDQLKVLTSYKIIQLILQALTFHYITAPSYLLTSLYNCSYTYFLPF